MKLVSSLIAFAFAFAFPFAFAFAFAFPSLLVEKWFIWLLKIWVYLAFKNMSIYYR